MMASRYMAGMSYNPALRTAAYGGLRPGGGNSLAPVYAPQPGIGFGMPNATAGGGASLSGGASGGALSGGATQPPMPQMDPGRDQAAEAAAMNETLGLGAPSTGNPVTDAMMAAQTLGPAAVSLMGGPMGLAGLAAGGLVAGALRGFGREDLARDVFNASFGSPMGGPYGDLGNPVGGEPTGPNLGAGGLESGGSLSDPSMATDPNTATGALSGSMASGMNYGGVAGTDDGGLGNPGFGGGYTEGNFGGDANSAGGGLNDSPGASSPGGDASQGAGSNASEYSRRNGGPTRWDTDGQLDEVPIRAHENEYVIRPEATMHYGPDIMAAINAGAIPRNALMAMMPQRRPMQAANHLVQMMMARG